jgi:hypothetical protein
MSQSARQILEGMDFDFDREQEEAEVTQYNFQMKECQLATMLCQDKPELIEKVASFRALSFKNLPVKISSYRNTFFDEMRRQLDRSKSIFDQVESFNIPANLD